MAKHCNDCLHYEVCRLLIGERELYVHDIACHFSEQCGGYKKKADYTKVVRCKDCKYYTHANQSVHWNEKALACFRKARISVKQDDFCSYGERREGE